MKYRKDATYLHMINNETVEVLDKDLDGYIRYGSNWVTLSYKNGVQEFIPNVRISSITRGYK